jgi:predicted membrane chloride channel (bestrophin family)
MERQHRPCSVAAVMSAVLARAHLDSVQRSVLDGQLTEYMSMMGGCERILKTPIPAAYSRWAGAAALQVLEQ